MAAFDPQLYRSRRETLLGQIGSAAALFPAAPVAIRNHDVAHDYRQDSDLYYLTGFEEPRSMLLLLGSASENRSILFVEGRDPRVERWEGPRAGVEGAVQHYGLDAAYPIEELPKQLGELLQGVERLYVHLGRDPEFDRKFFSILNGLRSKSRRGIKFPVELVEPSTVLHELRLIKAAAEIAALEKAIQISLQAHERAQNIAKPGVYEYEVEAELLRTFRAGGSARPAYGPIVGSGDNATVLHYRQNNRQMQDGDLLLIDAGAEYDYYAADITRTFAVSGRFSSEQKAIHDLVQQAQDAAVAVIKPQATLDDVHDAAVDVLVEGLVSLGLCGPDRESVLKDKSYQQFYMHRTSHWLGMDVHDVGVYRVNGKCRALEAGMVFTVEPGLYISRDANVPEPWKGIGVRIEDDVLVTANGKRVLSR